jgi:hypothetical protein
VFWGERLGEFGAGVTLGDFRSHRNVRPTVSTSRSKVLHNEAFGWLRKVTFVYAIDTTVSEHGVDDGIGIVSTTTSEFAI